MKEFFPLKAFQVILNRWWVIALCIVLGGGIGLLFHYFHPTLYEAEAVLAVSMDFPPNGSFSQYEEDYAFNSAAVVIFPAVLAQEVVNAVRAQGYSLTVEDFTRWASLERKQSIWELRVRHPHPETAAKAASLWAAVAYDQLEEARYHALQADQLTQQLNMLQNCLNYAVDSSSLPAMSDTVCNPNSLDSIQSAFDETSERLAQEKTLSRGVISVLVFDYSESAYIPVYPVAYGRNRLVLAGAFVGLIAGIWLVNSLKRWRG